VRIRSVSNMHGLRSHLLCGFVEGMWSFFDAGIGPGKVSVTKDDVDI
jgi:hypothetical protein